MKILMLLRVTKKPENGHAADDLKVTSMFLKCLATVELSRLYFYNCSDRVYEDVLNLVVRLLGRACMIDDEISRTS